MRQRRKSYAQIVKETYAEAERMKRENTGGSMAGNAFCIFLKSRCESGIRIGKELNVW